MSGGSYNYLCCKESYDIHERKEELNQMRDRLIELGFTDAAGETESVLLMLQSFEVRLQTRIDRLKDVWRSVEWMDNGDSGLDGVQYSVEQYREL
jgi:hypothetical protein